MTLNHNWLTEKARAEYVDIKGIGIVAVAPLKKDELIAVWGGSIITGAELNDIVERRGSDFQYPVQIAEGFWIGPRSQDELDYAEFFNHSCDPNAGIKGQVILVAMRDIEIGEEITFDYAMAETEEIEMECKCGSSRCRGVITSDDWKDPELQLRYKGYLSLHVQQKVKSLRRRTLTLP